MKTTSNAVFALVASIAAAQPAKPAQYGWGDDTTSAPAASTTYACNPAHAYPEGQSCVSTNGGLTLLPPTTSAAAATTTYACNPAHAYPDGQSCVSTNGGLTLLPPTTTASAQPTSGDSQTCYAAYNKCRTAPDANMSFCASKYAECLGYNPFANNGTNTVTPKPNGPVYTTKVVTQFTTYCPEPTTLTYNNKTYTVTSATTLTITNCPCTVTTPVQSKPAESQPPQTGAPAPSKPAESHPSVPQPPPGTVSPAPSKPAESHPSVPQPPPGTVSPAPAPSMPAGSPSSVPQPPAPPGTVNPGPAQSNAASQTVSAPASTRSGAIYTGAADKLNVGGALMLGALGMLAL